MEKGNNSQIVAGRVMDLVVFPPGWKKGRVTSLERALYKRVNQRTCIGVNSYENGETIIISHLYHSNNNDNNNKNNNIIIRSIIIIIIIVIYISLQVRFHS